jgi:hypothetical protein
MRVPCAFCCRERWPKRLKVVVGANWHSCYGASWLTVPAYPTFKYLGASCYFRRYCVVLGNISKLKTYKTEKVSIAPDVIFRDVRAVKVERMVIQGAARYFGIPFRSLTRYCSKASEEDIRRMSRNPTFSTVYSKPRQMTSHVY